MVRDRLHVGVIGAGLGGLAAAIGIARAGHQVTILEQAAVLGEFKLMTATDWCRHPDPPNASRILYHYGLLEKIEAVAVRPKAFMIRSYSDGKILNYLEMYRYAERRYGYPYLHIHRADYHRILVEEATRLGVDLRLGSSVTSIDFEASSVQLRGKPSFHADLLLGCDGLKSVCREALLGRPDPPLLTGDLAYRIVIKVEDMKQHPDLRELVEKPFIHYWLGPNSHVVLYLLQGGDLCNIVLISPDNLPDLVNTAKADVQEMMDFFQDWDPKLRKVLGLVQETTKWRLQNSEEMDSWTHSSGRFALLGDACHATLPYLAQGAAQAVEDGAVIGRLFEHIKERSQIPAVLKIYEELRKNRTTCVVRGSTSLRDVFHMEDGPRQRERDQQLLESEPFEGYPNPWADPVYQAWLFGYDAFREADEAWGTWKEKGIENREMKIRPNL
ncbi:uncharacterized protein KY384_006797 [Bacidia gigantensis]|uniref:uncharacterized protein n=1 Tax=Bacidia gigantensis TaxID=2732470 RepID=UPI001D046808|nr:uncharacterized protein KY384_006797 [Bacidia gigantensis]KAG8527881.1 hypothetical protein KY384_006797 [Bacidia gigantensis]